MVRPFGSNKNYNIVHDELQTGISFYSRIPWILMLAFSALGAIWILIGIITGVISIARPDEESVAGTLGLFLWSLLACKWSYKPKVPIFSPHIDSSDNFVPGPVSDLHEGQSSPPRANKWRIFYVWQSKVGFFLVVSQV